MSEKGAENLRKEEIAILIVYHRAMPQRTINTDSKKKKKKKTVTHQKLQIFISFFFKTPKKRKVVTVSAGSSA